MTTNPTPIKGRTDPVRILLIVRREPGTQDPSWVVDATDEHMIDEWNGAYPPSVRKTMAEDPANTRELWVEVPDGAFDRLWQTSTVQGRVVDGNQS